MAQQDNPRRRSYLGWSVLVGAAALGLVGALAPRPPDLTVVSGAIYGFFLGAVFGVLADRIAPRSAPPEQ